MLRLLARFLRVLNSETDPAQIALAFALAAVFGLTPLWSLHNLLVLFLVLALRVNLSAFIVAWGLFSAVSYALDPLFHALGLAVLRADALQALWTALYNNPVGRLSELNNTVVMGSLLISLLLLLPVYYAGRLGVVQYRARLKRWVENTRLMTFLKANRFYRIYESLSS